MLMSKMVNAAVQTAKNLFLPKALKHQLQKVEDEGDIFNDYLQLEECRQDDEPPIMTDTDDQCLDIDGRIDTPISERS